MHNTEILTSAHDLVRHFQSINPQENLYVGIEVEKSGIYRHTLDCVQYDGEGGYMDVMQKLVDELGWKIESRNEDAIYELSRGETSITTEVDGRPELTGSPQKSLHDLARELRLHDNELIEIGNVFNIAWLPLGLHPLASNDDIRMLPKRRYEIFMEHDSSAWMHTWLKRMNGIHSNLSYTDEENLIVKTQTAFRVLPIVAAMFASSPFDFGKPSGYINTRRYLTKKDPPVPTALPSTILDEDFSLMKWIEHYVGLQVLLIKESDGADIRPENLTFSQWISEGYEGRFPSVFDFDQHVKTIWSDLRLRPSYIENRVADSNPYPLAMSHAALMKGLLMSSQSWNMVKKMTKGWTYEEILDLDIRASKEGLSATMRNRPLLSYAQELIIIANESLHSFSNTDASDNNESIFLAPLKEQILIKEKSPSEELLELWEGPWNKDARRILEWCEEAQG
ncbi:hypothetical protein COU78_05050 [Candidatus Peregrinibacteria bacterium CG10_big_fil_rev_8_21_14_0_10_49_24]|nr:MAG: hypothetical protein COV83_01420 [Candidatus Peregrinibacteria bacterium CG11_big_fil_rev_8_21_14_0_20_49_14]PIR50715.1 MAG: hypothetical protein COU78_05050 [Candidatus Peregrinibacteria bacterium CG10_big_fil_rev_8_21_14_0_10_49_24]PJA68241.1 MAG: hypothetical protein CO157_00760 [Candidatus Peregrinibacteria bacterium CG_4_9_14_3_um_filter_49_12]